MKIAWWARCIIVALLAVAMVVPMACNSQGADQAPKITTLVANSASVAPGGSSQVTCVASDPDGDALSYAWTCTGGTISGTGDVVTWIAPAAANTYIVKVGVSDGRGGIDNDSVAIVVVIAAPTPTPTPTPTAAPTLTPTPTSEAIPTSTVAPASTAVSTLTPTPTSAPSDGSIDIKSTPAGAKVIIDGIDTGSITPYVATHLAAGKHTVKLGYEHYKWRSGEVTVNGGETAYVNWALTYAAIQTLTIQPNASVGKDTFVSGDLPTDIYGGYPNMFIGKAAGCCRIYIQFDLSSMPSTAVIENATLGLNYSGSYGTRGNPASSRSVGVYRVSGSWNESTVTWNNQPTFDTAAVDTVLVPASYTGTFLFWNVTSLVNVRRVALRANYGMVLMDTDESTANSMKVFDSSDSANAAARPKLTIIYWDSTP